MAAGLFSGHAAADQLDTLNVVASGSITRDSNVLRLPASADPTGDTVRAVSAGLRLDKPYSLQRFQIDVTETRTRFANLPERNADTIDYRGAWLWFLTPRIGGKLEAQQVQSIVEGDESQGTQRNVRTTRTQEFSLDAWVSGGWHLILGADRREQRSESSVATSPDFRAVGAQAGAMYEARSGNSISAIQYARVGEYIDREFVPGSLVDTRYYESESELKITAKPTGRSALAGRVAWLARRHEHLPERDFSGLVGRLDYNWTVMGRLRVDAAARRSITATTEPFSSYRVEDGLTLAPSWQVAEKTSLVLRLDYSTFRFLGPVAAPPGPLRRDALRTAALTASWEATRNATLRVSLQRQRRWSNDPRFAYDATIGIATLVLTF